MTRKDFIEAFDKHLPPEEDKRKNLQMIFARIEETPEAKNDASADFDVPQKAVPLRSKANKAARFPRFTRVAMIVLCCICALFAASVVYASLGGYIPGITEWINPTAAAKHKNNFTKPDETVLPDIQTINKIDTLAIGDVPVQVDLHTDLPKEAVSSLVVCPYLITSNDADALIQALDPESCSLENDGYDLYAVVQTENGSGTIRFDGRKEKEGYYISYLEYVAGNTGRPGNWDAAGEHPMTLSEQEAEEKARELLRKIGLDNLTLRSIDRYSASSNGNANARHHLSVNDTEPAYRYRLSFSPKYEGLTYVHQPGIVEPRESHYALETIIVDYTSDVISQVNWKAPLQVYGEPDEIKELLPFEQLYEKFKNDVSSSPLEEDVAREVYNQLSFGWIRITSEDDLDHFTLVPTVSLHGEVIVGFPDGVETQGHPKHFIYNAITGQRIDPQTRLYMDPPFSGNDTPTTDAGVTASEEESDTSKETQTVSSDQTSAFYNPDWISLIGEKGAPEWEAAHEWQSFYWAYFFQHDNDDEGDCESRPETYYDFYGCNSQEEKDKLDEILTRYELEPHHSRTYIHSFDELCTGLEIRHICSSSECNYGYYYDDGSFHMEPEEFSLDRYTYGVLHQNVVEDLSRFTQWEYTTTNGILITAYEQTESWYNSHYILCGPFTKFIIKRPESVVVLSINYDAIYDNDNHITGFKIMSHNELKDFLEEMHLENIP